MTTNEHRIGGAAKAVLRGDVQDISIYGNQSIMIHHIS